MDIKHKTQIQGKDIINREEKHDQSVGTTDHHWYCTRCYTENFGAINRME
jgi:hypothetical protein